MVLISCVSDQWPAESPRSRTRKCLIEGKPALRIVARSRWVQDRAALTRRLAGPEAA
jgi:hypothetical protein